MKLQLRILGYWQSTHEPQYPDPSKMIDESWNPEEKKMILDYLSKGKEFLAYRGMSWCRFNSGQSMGSLEYTDGTYVWPEDFAYYIKVHNVKPPSDFIEHCKSELSVNNNIIDHDYEIDYTWWVSSTCEAISTDRILTGGSLEGSFKVQFDQDVDLDKATQFLRQFSAYKHEKQKRVVKAIKQSDFTLEITGVHSDIGAIKESAERLNSKIIFLPQYE